MLVLMSLLPRGKGKALQYNPYPKGKMPEKLAMSIWHDKRDIRNYFFYVVIATNCSNGRSSI